MKYLLKPIAHLLIICIAHNSVAAAYIITNLIFFLPLPAFADAFLDKATEGQALGSELLSGFSVPNVNESTGTITMTNGLVAGQQLQQNELFQEIQPGSMDAAAASYGDASSMGTEVNNTISNLTAGSSTHAYAYQTLLGANTSMPNIYNDPIWQTSDDVFSLTSPIISELFSGCEKKTNFSETSCPIHIEDLKTCKKTLKTESCKVNRIVTAVPSPIRKVSGQGGFVEASNNKILMEMGTRDMDATSNACPAAVWTMTVEVTDTTRIYSVKIIEAGADDNVHLQIDGVEVFNTGGCSDRSTWSSAYNIDITNNLNSAGTHTLRFEVWAGGDTNNGGGYAVMEVSKKGNVEEEFLDYPAGCRARLFASWPPTGTAPPFVSSGSLNDQASTDWWQCTDAPNSRTFGSVLVTSEEFGAELQPILPEPPASPPAPICYQAETRVPGHIKLDCFLDKDGYEICPEYDYDLNEHSSCEPLQTNPACSYVGETCAEGAISPITGVCQEFIITYDCGQDYQASCDLANVGEQTICDSPIRCMGGECVTPDTESNTDFIAAATALQTLNQAQQNNGCDASTGTCKLFGGEALECQMADLSILGQVDCCNMPIEGSWIDYMNLSFNTWELADSSVELYSLANNGLLLTEQVGAWNMVATNTVLQAPVSIIGDTYSAVTGTFTSMYDSVASMLTGDIASTAGIEAIKQQMVQWMGEWIASTFGEAAASTLLTATSTTAGAVTTTTYSMAGSLLSSIITVVGIIYAIYQIAKLVVQLIFACTEEEIKLNMLKSQKLCTKPDTIGDYCSADTFFGCVARKEVYCCYPSPFARIFQEQARPQLGLTFGDPKIPSCEGLSIAQIGSLDFDKMDFGEWINMLKGSNHLPMDAPTADQSYDVNAITTGKLPGTPTQNAAERLDTQTGGSDMDAIRQHLLDNL
jgi:conjugal transfer mating pair stabilization protein TraN